MKIQNVVIALDEMHSSAVVSLLVLFFCQVAVGVGASVEKRPVGTGTDGTPAGEVGLSD